LETIRLAIEKRAGLATVPRTADQADHSGAARSPELRFAQPLLGILEGGLETPGIGECHAGVRPGEFHCRRGHLDLGLGRIEELPSAHALGILVLGPRQLLLGKLEIGLGLRHGIHLR
jgi:hypothetical protein